MRKCDRGKNSGSSMQSDCQDGPQVHLLRPPHLQRESPKAYFTGHCEDLRGQNTSEGQRQTKTWGLLFLLKYDCDVLDLVSAAPLLFMWPQTCPFISLGLPVASTPLTKCPRHVPSSLWGLPVESTPLTKSYQKHLGSLQWSSPWRVGLGSHYHLYQEFTCSCKFHFTLISRFSLWFRDYFFWYQIVPSCGVSYI